MPSMDEFTRLPSKIMSSDKLSRWDARWSYPVPHDNAYYGKCMIGGVLSCGATHLAITRESIHYHSVLFCLVKRDA